MHACINCNLRAQIENPVARKKNSRRDAAIATTWTSHADRTFGRIV